MEKKELAERIVEYASNYHWNLEGWGDNVPEDDDLEKELTGIVTFVFEELDKAREEGYQDCMDDIWEEARGLRGWTEHDGSISATDIEAGLQEAYLNIENKLKDNK